MLIVDASCLYEVLVGSAAGVRIGVRLAADDDQAAPHLIDAEVPAVIRSHLHTGKIDATTAHQAVDDLISWPGERHGHLPLIRRAWELRHSIRFADGLYVALAEAMEAPLLTRDARLAAAHGPRCRVEVVA